MSPTQIKDGELMAAADLGSNSFHLVVARCEHGEPRVIDRVRDSVRLAAGLHSDGTLDAERRERAMACLARFGQRMADIPATHVRAVATNAVRQLKSPGRFLADAEGALGHPVEVVSGREEGRLIFLGVSHALPLSRERRLVMDIGGGSTEFIIGRHLEPQLTESVQVGCVASSLRFFRGGKITRKRWQRARHEIGVLLQQFTEDFRDTGWLEAYGSSGTAKAIGNAVTELRLSDDGITAEALAGLRERVLEAGHVDRINLPGVNGDRSPVIAGGIAILEAAFEALGIERMQVCESAMREGLLWDLLGRAGGTDPRASSIDSLATRYGVDKAQARRVEATALMLFDQVANAWQLDAEAREWLSWAARVHELGLAIAHSQHHHHGGYILRNADLAGFSRQEQHLLAACVECHRRKPDRDVIAALPPRHRELARHITTLLRLAVLLRRGRRPEPLPAIGLAVRDGALRLSLPTEWIGQHPLTEADLKQEQALLADVGSHLELCLV
nr:Ppx/GppA family phosphatase [Oleiagrimonas sp. C23AA]